MLRLQQPGPAGDQEQLQLLQLVEAVVDPAAGVRVHQVGGERAGADVVRAGGRGRGRVGVGGGDALPGEERRLRGNHGLLRRKKKKKFNSHQLFVEVLQLPVCHPQLYRRDEEDGVEALVEPDDRDDEGHQAGSGVLQPDGGLGPLGLTGAVVSAGHAKGGAILVSVARRRKRGKS